MQIARRYTREGQSAYADVEFRLPVNSRLRRSKNG